MPFEVISNGMYNIFSNAIFDVMLGLCGSHIRSFFPLLKLSTMHLDFGFEEGKIVLGQPGQYCTLSVYSIIHLYVLHASLTAAELMGVNYIIYIFIFIFQ
jgi:hypothetical protein